MGDEFQPKHAWGEPIQPQIPSGQRKPQPKHQIQRAQ